MSAYVIKKSSSANLFFTASSAYDCPTWVGPQQATVYESAELAARAVSSLRGYGDFTAKLVPLSELSLKIIPSTKPLDLEDIVAQDSSDADSESIDLNLGGEECDDEPCDVDLDDLDSDTDLDDLDCDDEPCDTDLDDDAQEVEYELEADPRYDGRTMGMAQRVGSGGARKLGEGTIPLRKGDDPAKPSENNTTSADNSMKFDTMKFKAQPYTSADEMTTKTEEAKKIAIPSHITKQLKAVISDLNAEAKKFEQSDEGRASFAMTAAAALTDICDALNSSDSDGMTRAALKMSSCMSPIVNLIPPAVVKFILSGGKKASLQETFNALRRGGR